MSLKASIFLKNISLSYKTNPSNDPPFQMMILILTKNIEISSKSMPLTIISQVALKDRCHYIDLSAVDVEFSNKVNFKTQLTFTFSPLFYAIKSNGPHNATCTWLDYDEFICLDSYPCDEFIIILHKNLAFKEMGVKTFTFRQYIQDLSSSLNLIHVTNAVILFQDVFLIVLFFCICRQGSKSSFGNEVLVLK